MSLLCSLFHIDSMGGSLVQVLSTAYKVATVCSGPPQPETTPDPASWSDRVPLKPLGLCNHSPCLFQTWPAGLLEGPQSCMPWPVQSCLPQFQPAGLPQHPWHCVPACQSYLAHPAYIEVTLTQGHFFKRERGQCFISFIKTNTDSQTK